MIEIYARYHGGRVSGAHEASSDPSHHSGDLAVMTFLDEESARSAFMVAGRGTTMTVEDDEGAVFRNVDTLCDHRSSTSDVAGAHAKCDLFGCFLLDDGETVRRCQACLSASRLYFTLMSTSVQVLEDLADLSPDPDGEFSGRGSEE